MFVFDMRNLSSLPLMVKFNFGVNSMSEKTSVLRWGEWVFYCDDDFVTNVRLRVFADSSESVFVFALGLR